jgi:hypothetical protein
MIPRNNWNLVNVKEESKWETLTNFLKDVYTILNKGIVVQDNFRGALLDIEFTVANEDLAIIHGLSYTPTKYIVLNRSSAFNVYDGSSSADQKFFYLRASSLGTATVLIF